MEQKIKKMMLEKIKKNELAIGLNSTLRAITNKKLDAVVYASNISADLMEKLSKLDVQKYEYDGDSEALSIALGKSFNIVVLGLMK